MPTDQLTLAKHRQSSAQSSRADKQAPAQFVQKLYQIVDDESTDHLIKWTESGDSFVVLDHERLGRELLGHWFKHQNWSTFVRQLNMYGFRKQPHLQRGVLKGGADSEHCNYEHPYFRRGQPELLGHIHRKNQQGAADKDTSPSYSNVDAPTPSNALSAKRSLDVNAILEGITAIKQHQANISAELQDLRSQNSRLWEQSFETQARFQKQEDTINRILRFLAGVFGRPPGEVREENGHDGHHSDGVLTTTRKPQRLMIGDVPKPQKTPVMTQVEDEDDLHGMVASIESPAQTVHTPSVATASPPLQPTEDPNLTNVEPLTLAQIMQSEPEQLKKLLAALSTQPVVTSPSPSPSPSSNINNNYHPLDNMHQLAPYASQFDFSRSLPPSVTIQPELAQNDAKLQQTWVANEVIDQGVNELEKSLSEFMANIGMDTNEMDKIPSVPLDANPNGLNNEPPFDFDALFNTFDNPDGSGPSGVGAASGIDVTSDLMYPSSFEPIPDTSDHTASPILAELHEMDHSATGSGPTSTSASRGQKRKSDVADLGALGVDLGTVDTSILPLSVNDNVTPATKLSKRRR